MIRTILLALVIFASTATFAADPPQGPPAGSRGQGQRGGGIMMMMDTNKDGKISKDEFTSWFAKVDTDKDEFISAEELKVAQDAFRAANGLGQGRGPGGPRRNAPQQ